MNYATESKHELQNVQREKELEKLEKELECSHQSIEKIHSSSGICCIQTILCKDCDLTLAQGTSLFPPSQADKVYARGN